MREGGCSSRTRAGLADDSIAALTNAAAAVAADAGLLDGRGNAVVVLGETPFTEIHRTILLGSHIASERDIIDAALRPRAQIAEKLMQIGGKRSLAPRISPMDRSGPASAFGVHFSGALAGLAGDAYATLDDRAGPAAPRACLLRGR
jgi:hypothetical protein